MIGSIHTLENRGESQEAVDIGGGEVVGAALDGRGTGS
jgi:hypothetical protein